MHIIIRGTRVCSCLLAEIKSFESDANMMHARKPVRAVEMV